MKMFARFVPFMLVTAMSVFTACGGDSGSNADSEEPVSSSAVKKSSSSKANSSSSKKVSSSSAKSSFLRLRKRPQVRTALRLYTTRRITP